MPNSPHLVAHDASRAPPSVTTTVSRKPLPSAPSAYSVSNNEQHGNEREAAARAQEKEVGNAEQTSENFDIGSNLESKHLDSTGSGHKRRKIVNVCGKLIALPSIFSTRPGAERTAQGNGRLERQDDGRRRWYLGLSSKRFVIAVAVGIVLLLVLIVGLAVGLTRTTRAQNLPLPTNKDLQTGDLTYYMPGLGACGITNKDSDSIVAVSRILFDAAQRGSDPNQNPLCGRKIRTTRFNEKANSNRSVDLTVTDRCVGCKATDIDVTTSAFDQLADRDRGRVLTTWAWLD